MRRVLNAAGTAVRGLGRLLVRHAIGLAGYPAAFASAARRSWHGFFFPPADPTPLGLIRIASGLLMVWSFLTIGLDLHGNLGSDGWADPRGRHPAPFWKGWRA